MKKKTKLIAALAMGAMLMHSASAFAEGSNFSCVMMKFTDDTRFDRVESTGTLSDLVLEKLLNSGKFNFKETKIIERTIRHLTRRQTAPLGFFVMLSVLPSYDIIPIMGWVYYESIQLHQLLIPFGTDLLCQYPHWL